MDYDVGHVLNGNAGPAGDVDVGSSAVDCLERVHHQLLLQLDGHVAFEDDPQRLVLDDGVPESPRFRVYWVVARVGDHVDFAVSASNGVLSEPNCAVRQPLPVLLPFRVAPPAIVDRVSAAARKKTQTPSRRIDAPAQQQQQHRPKVLLET